jgi:hypothetical protein
MKKLLLILVLIGLVYSCKKEKLEGDKEIFIGKWKWIYTTHIHSFCDSDPNYTDILNPESEGAKYSMKFFENGIVKYYENENYLGRDRMIFEYFLGEGCDVGYFKFSVFLDNDDENTAKSFDGCISNDSLILIRGFPFDQFEYGCEVYTSYFVKE